MKKLLIYKFDGDFIVEKINEFDHSTKRHFETEEGLSECLSSYKDVLYEYEIKVSEGLRAIVVNYLYGGVKVE